MVAAAAASRPADEVAVDSCSDEAVEADPNERQVAATPFRVQRRSMGRPADARTDQRRSEVRPAGVEIDHRASMVRAVDVDVDQRRSMDLADAARTRQAREVDLPTAPVCWRFQTSEAVRAIGERSLQRKSDDLPAVARTPKRRSAVLATVALTRQTREVDRPTAVTAPPLPTRSA